MSKPDENGVYPQCPLRAGHADRWRNLSMKVIYMAHPVSGDVENNIKRAKEWMRWIEQNFGVAVSASWRILECEIWDDDNPEHRAAGLRRDMAVLERCDELWLVGGRISKGMTMERAHAEKRGLVIRDFTHYGAWPFP